MATSYYNPGRDSSDGLIILGASVVAAVVCEAVSWLLIYRSASYQSLRSAIARATKRLDSLKNQEGRPPSSSPSKAKKVDRVENSLKNLSRDLSVLKLKSGAIVALILLFVFGILNDNYAHKPVAKIPFVPLNLVQKMSHRGLPGDDMTDCSMPFLYFLCSVSIRTNLQKYLGFSPPRGTGSSGIFPVPDKTS